MCFCSDSDPGYISRPLGKEKRREAVGDRDKARDNQAAVMLMKDSHFKLVLTYPDYSFSHPHSYRLSYILSLQQPRTVLLTTFACIIDFGKWEEEILASWPQPSLLK